MSGPSAGRPLPIRVSAVVSLLVALLALGGCDCGGGSAPPNILLIVVDTFRADHLGCYDYARPTSPALDALSREGITFDAAYSTAPWTLPAFASILTSRYPWEHGASNDYFPVGSALPTVARELKTGGYETAAFVSHIYTSSNYGFRAGFDRFEDFGITENYRFDEGKEPIAEVVVGGAVDLLRREELEEPYFLLVHIFDPHWDYGAPGEWRNCFTGETPEGIDGTYRTIARFLPADSLLAPDELEYVRGLYDGEVRYVDSWIDTLIREFDRRSRPDRSVVLVTSDHGEEFQEHASVGHAFTFYDEVLRVPLILRDRSRVEAGRRFGDPVTLLDVFPTLLDAAGLEIPEGVRGRSLYGAAGASGRVVLAGTTREGRFGRAAISDGSKLVWDREGYRLFRPVDQPREMENLRESRPEDAARLAESIAGERAPGGWTFQWRGDGGEPPELAGSLRVNGFLIDVVPHTKGDFQLLSADDRSVRFRATGGGSVSIRTEPPSAPVTIQISINGDDDPRRILIGRDRFHPPAPSFGLDPGAVAPGLLDAPVAPPPLSAHVSIWKEGGVEERETIQLDREERERLRALGYF